MRRRLEALPDGIIKHTVVYTEELIHGTDSNQEEIIDSNINLTWCDSMEGNSSAVNLGSLYNRIDIIFTRPEMTKISRGKDDN
ncbi:hypothetical protein TNCV_3524131 [Trichonephila clavipes]|uniref:Uncharacterized protein n=1 Tax=Trichonephila clavipes TaxID=2585209 RepID=A0A8X6S311_TRICX|nr:hypothetical protein TNCV_3524131 [Trichonephila clavipes]